MGDKSREKTGLTKIAKRVFGIKAFDELSQIETQDYCGGMNLQVLQMPQESRRTPIH